MAAEPIATVAVFLGIYLVIHLFTAYVRRRFGRAGRSGPDPRAGFEPRLEGPSNWNPPTEARPSLPTDAVRCPACGSPNDPTFTYCRNCIATLGAGSAGVARAGNG